MSAQLQLAKCYAALDPGQSVAIMQPIIVLINQLVEAASILDGYEHSYLDEGEWMKRGHSNLANMVNSIGQNLGALARSDAQAARSLSNQFARQELRLMAQLEIAQNLLSLAVKSSNFSRNSNPVLRLSPVNHLRQEN